MLDFQKRKSSLRACRLLDVKSGKEGHDSVRHEGLEDVGFNAGEVLTTLRLNADAAVGGGEEHTFAGTQGCGVAFAVSELSATFKGYENDEGVDVGEVRFDGFGAAVEGGGELGV